MCRISSLFRAALFAAFFLQNLSFSFSQAPTLSIPTQGAAGIEGIGFCFFVKIDNPLPASSTSVDILVDAGTTASQGSDFSLDPVTITFPAGFAGNMTACITTTNDAVFEPVEFVNLKLANATNGATITNGTIAFTFYDDDSISTTFPCQQPFISEYVHSLVGGESQALEIFNPTGGPADLSAYSVKIFHNGASDPTLSIPLSGTLAPNDVFVLANSAAVPNITGLADLLTPQLNYTGDDAVGLYQGDALVDVIGVIGQDPGLYWPAGFQSTASSVLVRNAVARQGETSWYISAGKWDGYDQSDFSHLGAHFMLPCGPDGSFPPLLSFVTNDAVFDENIGGLGILVALYYPKDVATTVNIAVDPASTATPGVDFMVNETSLTFPANFSGAMGVGISILDESLVELDETIVLRLTDASNGGVLLDSVWMLTILNDDASGTSQAEPAAGIRLSPNPAAAGAVLSVLIPEAEAEELCLQNIAGTWSKNFLPADNQGDPSHWKIATPVDLPAGLYLLYLKTGEKTVVAKLVIRP